MFSVLGWIRWKKNTCTAVFWWILPSAGFYAVTGKMRIQQRKKSASLSRVKYSKINKYNFLNFWITVSTDRLCKLLAIASPIRNLHRIERRSHLISRDRRNSDGRTFVQCQPLAAEFVEGKKSAAERGGI